jgi:hypothetical protein
MQYVCEVNNYKEAPQVVENRQGCAGPEILIAEAILYTVLWDVTPCSLGKFYRRFGGTATSMVEK